MVYILEISPKMHHANYYVGYCDEDKLETRFAKHQKGRGANITSVAVKRGHSLKVVAVLPNGSRADERKIKNRKNTPKLVKRIESGNTDWILK